MCKPLSLLSFLTIRTAQILPFRLSSSHHSRSMLGGGLGAGLRSKRRHLAVAPAPAIALFRPTGSMGATTTSLSRPPFAVRPAGDCGPESHFWVVCWVCLAAILQITRGLETEGKRFHRSARKTKHELQPRTYEYTSPQRPFSSLYLPPASGPVAEYCLPNNLIDRQPLCLCRATKAHSR